MPVQVPTIGKLGGCPGRKAKGGGGDEKITKKGEWKLIKNIQKEVRNWSMRRSLRVQREWFFKGRNFWRKNCRKTSKVSCFYGRGDTKWTILPRWQNSRTGPGLWLAFEFYDKGCSEFLVYYKGAEGGIHFYTEKRKKQNMTKCSFRAIPPGLDDTSAPFTLAALKIFWHPGGGVPIFDRLRGGYQNFRETPKRGTHFFTGTFPEKLHHPLNKKFWTVPK